MEDKNNDLSMFQENHVIFHHQPCQTREAKYLCIDDIHGKFHRPNYYDIGGTYIEDVPDYWFFFKTEAVADIYLAHIFITNKQESSISVQLSNSNVISTDQVKNAAFLPSSFTRHNFEKLKEGSITYLTTFTFNLYEVHLLKDKNLYIPISFNNDNATEIKECNEKVYDFRMLLDDPVGSDFTIESEDGAQFKVHKTLLTLHSEVFRAMLKEDTAEAKNGYVKLIDVEKEDLQNLLRFIYTGTLTNTDHINFISMLILADRFDLKGLRELSEHSLIQQLSTDNALEMLAFADSYNSHALKTAAFVFIKRNKLALENTIFNELNNAALVRELCKFLVI